MDVSVIIVNYNTCNLTSNCIQSIIKKTEGISYEIIVIDNDSSDDSVEFFERNLNSLILIKNSKNIGFGRACNQGLNIAKGKYSFFLNSDTLLVNNAIKVFFDFYENKASELKVGAIGCLLLDKNLKVNQSFDSFLSPRRSIWDLFYPYLLYLKLIKKRKYPQVTFENGYCTVNYVIGADIFIETNLIRSYNGFDPIFFMYYEETDLQYRLFLDGYSSLIINGPQIIHLEGQSENKNSNKPKLILEQSVFKYLRKHYITSKVILVKLIFIILYTLKLFRFKNLIINFNHLKKVYSY